jgi:hypothetical protein
MFKSASVSWFLIAAAVATALMALATGCLPEVPGGSSRDAGKESAKPADAKFPETVLPGSPSIDAPLNPAPNLDVAPAEHAPLAVDGGAEVIDAGAERIDMGTAAVDAGPEIREVGREMVDVAPVIDAAPDVVDVARELVADVGPELVDSSLPETPPPPINRAPRAGEIVIDEMLVNPAGTDIGREWIELRSLAPVPLNLAELHVADRLSDVAVAGGVLAPGEVLLLGQSLDPAKNGGAPIAVIYGTTVSLNNDGDTISLCWGACETGVVLDRYTYGALGTPYDGHALILSPSADPTRKGCPAQDPFGTGESFGTPGRANPACPP